MSRPRWRSCARRLGPPLGRRRRASPCPTTWSRSSPRSAIWPGSSTQVNQRSGVSACGCRSATSRCSAPTPCAGRCVPASTTSSPASCDLEALAASSSGKIEIESLEEGRDGSILENLVKAAVLTVYKERVAPDQVRDVDRRVRRGRRRPRRRRHRLGRRRRGWSSGAGAAGAGRGADRRRRIAGRGRRGGRVRAGRTASVQAVEQGLLRHQRHLPRP